MPLRPLSLRAQLASWFAGVLALSLGAYSVVVFVVLSRHVYADLDLHLHELAEVAAEVIETRPDGRLAWPGGFGKTDEEPEGARFVEVWTVEGDRLLVARSGPDADLGPLRRPAADEAATSQVLVDGRLVRTLT